MSTAVTGSSASSTENRAPGCAAARAGRCRSRWRSRTLRRGGRPAAGGRVQTGPLPGAPNGVKATAPIASPTPRPLTPGRSWATARSDHDVGGPASRRRQQVCDAGGVAVELGAAEDDDPDHRQHEGSGVAGAARRGRGDGDRPDELDRHALAEVGAVDGEVEERVHRRRGDAEDRRRGELAARSNPARTHGTRRGRRSTPR